MAAQLSAGGSLLTPMSWQQYVDLGESVHCEYYDGVAVVNPPNRRHVRITKRLTRILDEACPPGYEALPEFGWQPRERTVFEPDVMVADVDAAGADLLRAAPLLIVEVVSPSTRGEDLGRKMRAYAEGGAGWYWVVEADPDAAAGTISVHRNSDDPETGHAGSFRPYLVAGPGGRLELDQPFPISFALAEVFDI